MPLSALSTMSLPSVQTVIEFTNRIPKIMVQFCYLRQYFGIDNVCRRLLQWIARIKNGLKLRPTTRYRTYSNQISTRLRSDNESAEEGDFEVVYGRTCMTMSERSVRDHDWCVWIYETGVILMVIRLAFSVTNKIEQSNLFDTDTKGTEPIVRFTEVSVL